MAVFFVASIGTVEATVTVKSLTRLTDMSTDEWAPSWSPDGTKIVFTSNAQGYGSIWIMDFDGNNEIAIPNTMYSSCFVNAWNHDGTKVTFQKTIVDGSSNKDVYVINIDGTDLSQITTDWQHEGTPAWSPDGTKIAYIKNSLSGGYDLWIMKSNGDDKQQITTNIFHLDYLSWSPDGTKIIFYSAVDRQIWMINADGTESTQLTFGEGNNFWPSWNSDDNIAYASDKSGNYDIWLMDENGNNILQLTTDNHKDYMPAWSPDGKKIAFVSDRLGSSDIWLLELDFNKSPVADAGASYVGYEGSEITFCASGSSDPDGDALTYRWDFDSDGDWDTQWLDYPTYSKTWYDECTETVTLEVNDGELTDVATVDVTIQNAAPEITSMDLPDAPVDISLPVVLSATFNDDGILDEHTYVIDWDIKSDDETSKGDADNGIVKVSHYYPSPGVYTIKLTIKDDDGGSDMEISDYVVVYDPEGGFVTGGGWIDSLEGNYIADPALTGKATFGFVSKYKKGATVPTGNTEFQFQVADLNFKSTSYDWLVVVNSKAMYKGVGTINGGGEYAFMLSAIDADLTPSTDVDLFRMKIWNETVVIYDNQPGESDDAILSTAIGGGSIIVHKEK